MEKADLIRAATVLAHNNGASGEELAELLMAQGFEEGAAYRLVAFLPSAFARPILEELGVKHFAGASVPTANGGSFEVSLEDQPEYRAALALAREHRRTGAIPREVYRAIVYGTSEIDAVSNAVNEGADVEGGALTLALLSTSHAPHVVRRRKGQR
jgi:hypothetical protein